MNITDTLPEMELSCFVKIMRDHFDVRDEAVEGKPYSVRFIGKPYNAFVPDCPSVQVTTHHRGMTRGPLISPHHVKAVLAKFELKEADFMAAWAVVKNQLEEARQRVERQERKPAVH